ASDEDDDEIDVDSSEQRRNFLERKRRDDLRSRFQALREEIPGLSVSSKTSKVAILKQATEYLLQLHARQRRQAQEKRKLKAKQQQLLRRIIDSEIRCFKTIKISFSDPSLCVPAVKAERGSSLDIY
uniref:Protein L-Myc-1a-like n=1 Tax=Sinocyclocheilus rhinocerous TaxID=307959 RepID=A0A673M6G1_9TELE